MKLHRWINVSVAVLALAGPAFVGTSTADAAPKPTPSRKPESNRALVRPVANLRPPARASPRQPRPLRWSQRQRRRDAPEGQALHVRRVMSWSKSGAPRSPRRQHLQRGRDVQPAVLAKLDHIFRCRKTDEERAVDPRLYEMLSRIYDHFDTPIDLISGFRFQRNEGSRHFHGSAMDICIRRSPTTTSTSSPARSTPAAWASASTRAAASCTSTSAPPVSPATAGPTATAAAQRPRQVPSKMWKKGNS